VETVNLPKAAMRQRAKGCTVPLCAGEGNVAPSRGPLYFAVLLTICISLNIRISQAQQVRPTESQVKAAYLFNFGKFVRWPTAANGHRETLEICVLGKNPFGSVLDATVKGETIDGSDVIARTVPSLQDAGTCNILFVSTSEEGRLGAILSGAKHLRALTVSDIPNFAERGGMIELVTEGNRIRFAVNMAPLGEAGLAVSSELLKVAVRVMGQNGGGN
jgi:hypothetical protein